LWCTCRFRLGKRVETPQVPEEWSIRKCGNRAAHEQLASERRSTEQTIVLACKLLQRSSGRRVLVLGERDFLQRDSGKHRRNNRLTIQ
jgi:hypothetical protein